MYASLKNVYWFKTKVGFSNELVTSSVLVQHLLLVMHTRVGQGWEGRVDVPSLL